ncbi:MAG TPA: hypothetical protein VFW38_09650 [Solirubrobacteraceae bacterium]|nr:hypothetical protein [Solirubrobacteraceae bacterium]
MRKHLAAVVVTVAALAMAAPAWAGFGFAEEHGFEVSVINQNGLPDTQAGSHPFAYSTTLGLKEVPFGPKSEPPYSEGGDTRDVEVELPPGMVGDPGAVPACPIAEFSHVSGGLFGDSHPCPDDTQVGVTQLRLSGGTYNEPVYNLAPNNGAPAEFGFIVVASPVVLVPRVRTGGDYGVSVKFSGLPEAYSLTKGRLTLWGVPADPRHNKQRGACLPGQGPFGEEAEGSSECPVSTEPLPFLTMPTSCSGPLSFRARVDSWDAPGRFVEDSTSIPGMTGCDELGFAPDVVVQPEPAEAASPTGLSVSIDVPQTYDSATGLATANLKDTTVTLPAGVALNPSAADGLAGCSEAQLGLHEAAPARCPNASKVGSVEITTPLLTHPLKGGVYLAQQGNLPGNGSNPFGSLLAIYIAIEDPVSGVVVKLAGEVKPDPVTGQIVTTFSNNPQVPFDSLKLSFFGGPRAALVSPPYCGPYVTTTQMTPWSGGASATPSATFQITSGPQGSSCLVSQPFSPQLTAGTTSNQAGGYSPFSLTFFRSDAEQSLSRIQVKTPPGLLGALAHVALCGEPQAAQGSCGSESEIGHVTVGVGAGSNPFYVTGKVFLTGSYNGAPYGLSFVVPAVAGPLNLGTVVVRGAVSVDPHTAVLTVTSEPLPQILQGIPLRVRAVNVFLDRKEFIFNPTSCEPFQVDATMSSSLGASTSDTSHFQVTNCAALSFKPQFKVYTNGHTSRSKGASLHVKLSFPEAAIGSRSNVAKVKVDLPKQLPSRLTTLQKACPAATFEADPANCSSASRVGFAEAVTPVMPVPLSGPAYFVSHGGAAFPDLVVVLEGYGVRVDLVGTTFINERTNITSSTFSTIPDVPVRRFQLYLPQGQNSALGANANLCNAKALNMPTAFVAQDGTQIHATTHIAVTGCKTTAARRRTPQKQKPKGKTARRAAHTARKGSSR